MCFQETKHDVFSDYDVMPLYGRGFDYSYLHAIHTRGGILLAWRSSSWSATSISSRSYSLLMRMRHVTDDTEWWLIVIYRLTMDQEKQAFLA
jgi:predicted DNA binding protein